MNKKYYVAGLVIVGAVAYAVWKARSNSISNIPASNSNVYVAPADLPPLPKASAVAIPTHGTNEKAQPKNLSSSQPDKILEGRADELNMLKKNSEENNKRIFARMKAEEVESLKDSIANDEILLKKIEKNGTGIEDYKFIQKNLEKRKKRLQALSK